MQKPSEQNDTTVLHATRRSTGTISAMNKRIILKDKVLAIVFVEPSLANAKNVRVIRVQIMLYDASSFETIHRPRVNKPNRKMSCR